MTRILVGALAVVLAAACNQAPPPAPPRLQVVATFYPLQEFTRQVAGDRADVVTLVPAGVEPHDWEPAPQDVAQIEKARVVVYNGAGFEPWIDRMLPDLVARGVTVVKATEGLPLVAVDLPGDTHTHGEKKRARGETKHGHRDTTSGAAKEAAHDGKAPHGKEGEGLDPHVWVDPVLAQAQVELIRAGLAGADPANAEVYAENASRYTAALAALHQAFEQGLEQCARRDVVVSHAAFGYLTRRYRLSQIPVMGLAPEAEPSPADLAAIVRFARRHKVRYIFFETLVSSKLAETLAREVGARTLVLDPVEGLTKEDVAAGKSYVSVMEENLENLRTALECR